jgi:exonuclease SbcC
LINSAHIINFQSHQDTHLDFHTGFNAIVGSTDSGKSAIYRSLRWTRFNKAANFISFWNRKKDGNPKEASSVTLESMGHSVSRVRSPTLNGYEVDGQTLAAIGRSEIPAKVLDTLNLSDINFFSQHNPPFLLTETAGRVAEILNDLIHLNDIDRILTTLDQQKRATKKALEEISAVLSETETRLLEFSWMDNAKDLLGSAEEISRARTIAESDITKISQALDSYGDMVVSYTKNVSLLDSITSLLSETAMIQKERGEVVQKFNSIDNVISSLENIQKSLNILNSIDASRELAECDSIQRELSVVSEDLVQLADWTENYTAKEQGIAALNKELNALKIEMAQMPLCPECGRPLEDQ